MKYNMLLIVTILLFLCSACSETVVEYEKPIEEELFISDNYTYPPESEEELAWALKEVGMDWQINERSKYSKEPDPSIPIALHTISNASDLVVSSLNLYEYNIYVYGNPSANNKKGNISFNYHKQTAEDYNRFQKEEWPLFWALAGVIWQSPEEISILGEQCMSYFNNYTENWQGVPNDGTLEWCGRQGNLNCRVSFGRHPLLEQYVLFGIEISNPVVTNYEMNNELTRQIKGDPLLEELSKVSEIDVHALSETDFELRLVKGHIEQLKPNDDILDPKTLVGYMPKNTDNYKKGMLVDETGSMQVYMTPTLLSEDDLAKERTHLVYIVNAPKPYCLIEISGDRANIIKQ